MTCAQTLQLMMLFPFFALKNAGNYVGSILEKLFGCRKDVFYRFLRHPDIDWRKIVHSINRRLLNRISIRTDAKKSENPVCMIMDDTEMEKTGKHSELLGMVHSHVRRKFILGYKGLFRDVSRQSIQLTVTERIWDIITSVVNTISEIHSTDPVELL
jgi:hypothetical protein